MVRDAARDYRHETRKSKDLAAKEAEIESKGYGVWVEAKGKGDWPSFAPIMREVSISINSCKCKCKCI